MQNPKITRECIINKSKNYSNQDKIRHTLYGLKNSKERRRDKTYQYAKQHKLSRLQMWNLAIKLLKSKDLEYLPQVTKDREDPFNPKIVLYAYVYRKHPMYIKYYVNNTVINLRSLHPTNSKDNRFKALKE